MKLNIFNLVLAGFVLHLLIISCTKQAYGSNVKKISVSKSQPSKSIQGGTEVNNIPPWIGAMYSDNDHNGNVPVCTVEFISPQYVLTALHCVQKNPFKLLKVQYRKLVNGNPIYPKVGVDRIIIYNDNYDIVLLQLKEKYPAPIVMAPIYHNYLFNRYKLSKDEVIFLGYGRLQITPLINNVNSILKEAQGEVIDTYSNSTMLSTIATNGMMTPADSGGPVLYAGLPTNKLIGVHIISMAKFVENAPSDEVLLTVDILKWIANTATVAIFNKPIEQELILPNKDNILLVSGWGRLPVSPKVTIYSSKNNYADSVASCDVFTFPSDNEWQCKVQFDSKYDYSKSHDYKVSMLSIGKEMDYVYFKLSEFGQNIEIIHPKKSKVTQGGSVEWFTYHTPVDESYLITGTGTPGVSLTYNLIDKSTKESDKSPCINTAEAIAPIPRNGVWRCRITVISPESEIYTFEVGVDKSKEPIPSSRKRPLEPKVDIVEYKVSPIKFQPYLEITNPLDKDITLYPYEINVDFFNNFIPMRLVLTTAIKKFYDNLVVPIVANESEYNSPAITNGDVGKASLSGSIYIDGDDEPIYSESIEYFLKKYFVSLTYPQNNSTVHVGEEVYPYGTAIDISDITNQEFVPELIVSVYIYQPGHKDNRENICDADINIGIWECEINNAGDIDIASLPHGNYILEADLMDANRGKLLAEKDVAIKIINQGRIINPPH